MSTANSERELRVCIWPDQWFAFEGTAAQLTEEGLIPEGFEWPRAAADKEWTANGFDYWLRRSRPEGHKGPMRSWLALDNWNVRVSVTGRDHHWHTRREFESKVDALRAEHRRLFTVEGSREWSANWRRYWKAREDTAFQTFKLLVPALVPQQRGRKARATQERA